MNCLFDPFGCLSDGIGGAFWGLVAAVPWWGWVLAALVLIGVVWKFAGWPGLIALAAGAGFILGRRTADEPIENVLDGKDAFVPRPKPKVTVKKKRRTIFDRS